MTTKIKQEDTLCEMSVSIMNWRKQENIHMKLAYPQVTALSVITWVPSAFQIKAGHK